jgi:hypothetical protein
MAMSTQDPSANSTSPEESTPSATDQPRPTHHKVADITPEQKRSIAAATLSELMKQAEGLKIKSEE